MHESNIKDAALAPLTTGPDAQFTWEDQAYPQATPETRAWMREQRGLIHAFLASPHGRAVTTPAPRRGRHSRKLLV